MENRFTENENILQLAKGVILEESREIAALAGLLDDNFEKAVNIILSCTGRVVVTGIGKSAVICPENYVATFNSTALRPYSCYG